MDNVTHSLTGLIVADAFLLLRERSAPGSSAAGLRGAALWTSAFANNGPDFDFLYAGITEGKLGYLLHHRGHTHTLAAALPLTLLWMGLAALVIRLRGLELDKYDYRALGGLAVFGSVLHVLMDYGNNYGVHPFWPLYDGWYYGDLIFIIEPWLMIILGGMVIALTRSWVLRGLVLCFMAALLFLAWTSPLAGVLLAVLISAFAVSWLAWMWRATARRRWIAGGVACGVLALCLLTTRYQARASVREVLDGDDDLQLSSLSSAPAPGNPLCWSLLAVQLSEDRYVVRQALASGLPGLFDVRRCSWGVGPQTAPLRRAEPPDPAASAGRIEWGAEFHAPLHQLLQMQRDDCAAAAFLRFARIPFWAHDGRRATLVGDLRYDRSRAIDFAELELVPDAPCPRNVPPWLPPLPILAD
jgi:inner membrane protein